MSDATNRDQETVADCQTCPWRAVFDTHDHATRRARKHRYHEIRGFAPFGRGPIPHDVDVSDDEQ